MTTADRQGTTAGAPTEHALQRSHRRRSHTPRRVVYGITIPGSAATLLRGQLGWFRSRGWDVHLVTSPGAELEIVARREQVTTHPLSMQREISPVSDVRALLRWIHLLLRLRPDVVNIGTPKAALLGSVAAWISRVPVRVYVMRGLRLEGARNGRERLLLWLAERVTVALATEIVCVSDSLRAEASARRLFGHRADPVVLGEGSSNGVDPDRWDPGLAAVDRGAVRAAWGVAPHQLVIGFVGRVILDKGVDTLIAAFDTLTELPVHLLVVGPVDDEELRPRITALGGRATYIDSTHDLSGIYAGMDVLCLPTLREGFPNVVLEAALAKVPAITTTATGARDSVVPGVTGWLVPPGDVHQLADTLRACVADRDRVREAGRAARARALRSFRPQDIWSGLEAIYLRSVPTCREAAGS